MKKVLYAVLDLLTVAFLIGAYVIQYFTKRKMGMLRWVNYKNLQFEKYMSFGVLKYVTVLVALILIIWIVITFKKNREMLRKIDFVMIVILCGLELAYLYITVGLSVQKIPSYYLILPLLGASVLMQLIRNGIAVGTVNHEK